MAKSVINRSSVPVKGRICALYPIGDCIANPGLDKSGFIGRILLGLCLLVSMPSGAEETGFRTYEDEMVYYLVRTYAEDEVIWLGDGGRSFLSLYREAGAGNSGRAAIILHSMGAHADWPEIIAPLRTGLPMKGWTTLSVQLPVLAPVVSPGEYGSTLQQAGMRIRDAVQYLHDRGYRNIALIGYSLGATSAVYYLVDNPGRVRAFAGISMQNHAFLRPTYDLISRLGQVRVPVLDIYAGQDFSSVVRTADDRRLAGTGREKPEYKQLVIRGANHYYSSTETELLEHISAWLNTIVPEHSPPDTTEVYLFGGDYPHP